MKLSKVACASLLVLCTSSLWAEKNEDSDLGEITITGEKLERTMQETVSSVQVFNDKKIEENIEIKDLKDVASQISNVTAAGWGYTIRGISSFEKNTGISSTSVTLDGAALSFFSIDANLLSTWDMEQAEILKGPQSTSQGRNSLAGAIVLKTKDPEFEANGKVKLSYGDYNTSEVAIMQTGPINEDLAFRLSAQRKASDGFITNDQLKEDDFNKSQYSNVRGKLLYLIDDESDLLLTINKFNNRDNGNTYVTGDPYERKHRWNTDGYYDSDSNSNSLEYKTVMSDDWDFKSLTTYTKTDHDRVTDYDALAGNAEFIYDNKDKDLSQEFRFDYQKDALAASIGLFYASGKKDANTDINGADASNLAGGAPLKVKYLQKFKEDYSNIAAFVNADYDLTEKLTLITGLRIDRDKRENQSNLDITRITDLEASFGQPAGTNAGIDTAISNLVGPGTMSAQNSLTNILPKVGLSYKLNDNVNLGFVFSKGYRPGGISVNPVRGEAKKYDPEFTNNYELSFRSNWLDKRLTANANVFYTQWKDQQIDVQGSSPLTEDTHTENAGESTLKGFELETDYIVNDQLKINSTFGYVKTAYKKYVSGRVDYSGNEFSNSPKITASAGFFWKNIKNIFVATNVVHTGDSYNDSENKLYIPSYTVVNSKIGYEKKDWSISLYANNLLNKKYYTTKTNNNDNTSNYDTGAPRVVGLNFQYKW